MPTLTRSIPCTTTQIHHRPSPGIRAGPPKDYPWLSGIVDGRSADWFEIVYDTSISLNKKHSPMLVPRGIGDGHVWNLIREQSEAFYIESRSVLESEWQLPKTLVQKAIQYGSAYKTLVWNSIGEFRESLRQMSSPMISWSCMTERDKR